MTKSELIERIVTHQGQLSAKDVELAIKTMLEQMSQALATGDRIEIRGFGSFFLALPRPARRSQPQDRGVGTPRRQVRAALQAGQGVAGSGQRAGVISVHSDIGVFMLWIRRILLMGGVLFIALLVVVMVLENRQVTHFELFGLLTPELPVVLYVALVFILGGFIGLLAGSSLLARANIRIKAIEKDLAKARKERDSLLARLSSSSDGG